MPYNATRKVLIEQWSEGQWWMLDSTSLGSAGTFNKKIENVTAGQARLRVWGQNRAWIEFLLPSIPTNDTLFDFGILNYSLMSGGLAYLDGTENQLYYEMMGVARKFQIKKDSISFARRNIDSSIPMEEAKLSALDAELNLTVSRNNTYFTSKMESAKGTFAGDIIAPLSLQVNPSDFKEGNNPDSLKKFYKEHLLDHIPFKDQRILRYNGFIKTLNNYSANYFDRSNPSKIEFIDRAMSKRNGNETVDLWLFQYLLDKFLQEENDSVVTYLLKWYAPDCSSEESHVGEETKTLISALQKCQVGQEAYNPTLPDLAGNKADLKTLCGKNKISLLYFWRSECPHCQEFAPKLQLLLDNYGVQGLGVIGISVDKNESDWRYYLQNNQQSWINLLVPEAQQKDIQSNFPITGTPTLIALDAQGKVISRMINRHTLGFMLQNYFENNK